MKETLLFLRPPRPLWPFNGPGSAFWPPLAFASMAEALRRAFSDLHVAILDAPVLEMGWKSLAHELRRRQPDYVGIGEEAVSCVEGLRAAKLAKECGSTVIVGGCFFGNVAAEVLQSGHVDVVVHGEGEITIVELVGALRDRCAESLKRVNGISFRDGGEVIRTSPRELIANLDALPLPAYDLLPMERYGRRSKNHAGLAAIELGRGCNCSCEFCVLWRQMGKYRGNRIVPHLRVKSTKRLMEEIRVLMDLYDRRFLGWVDPCFNAHETIPGELAERLLRAGRRVSQSAWVRADYVLRDEANGTLGRCVEAGLCEMYLGIERVERERLVSLRKGNLQQEAENAIRLLARRYPQVFTVGSFIYSLPGDSPAMVRKLFWEANRVPLDMTLFIPLTPLPGTPFWTKESWDDTGEAMREFDFLLHFQGEGLKARLSRTLMWCYWFSWPKERRKRFLGGLFARDARRRSISRRNVARLNWFFARSLWSALAGRNAFAMNLPSWYDS
jgi:anaerobic magnesium-protoporphyrin IX monomethyl ester cyclase